MSARSLLRTLVPDRLKAPAVDLAVGRPAARRALAHARDRGLSVAPREAWRPLLHALQRDCHSVLDIGTGQMQSLTDIPCPVRLGLDAHRPYLEHRQVPDAVPLNASALDLERLFVPGAVDLVQLMDVIEHFEQADADRVLDQARRVARRRVLLFTPRGEFPQEDFDHSGLGGEELQRHRSTWEPEDLAARGFKVIVMEDFHGPWNAAFVAGFGADAPLVDALLAFSEPGR